MCSSKTKFPCYTDKRRQKFVEDDVLVFRDCDSSSFLEDRFVIPGRMSGLESISNPIVLANPNRLVSRKTNVLVGSKITFEQPKNEYFVH
jgi:hypothetical protein